MRIGEMLKIWRAAKGLTLRELAPEIKIPVPTLSRIERDGDMEAATLAKIFTWATQEEDR